MELPTILIDTIEKTLDRGTFFSTTTSFKTLLPLPQFPSEERQSASLPKIDFHPFDVNFRKSEDKRAGTPEKPETFSNVIKLNRGQQQFPKAQKSLDRPHPAPRTLRRIAAADARQVSTCFQS